MSVSASALPGTATVGTPYSGSITCTNSSAVGTAAATNATCSISGLPSNLALGTCTPATPVASLAAGTTITCPVSGSPSAAGTSSVTASTSATNDGTNGNNSTTKNIVVAQAATTTTLTSSLNPSTLGQSVTFTATVAPSGTGTPTGTVQFKDGGTNIGAPVALVGGVATLPTSALTVGSHTLTAVYSGDTNFTTSTGSGLTQVVNAGASTTALSSSLNPSTFGTSVTFTATVSPVAPATGTPTGTVSFFDGATLLGTSALAAGTATLSSTSLSVGSHTIAAIYSGDTNLSGSTSSTLSQVVNQATQTITFNALANQALGSSPPALSATATSSLTVAFASQTPSVCTVSGTTVTLIATGTCTIRASQTGDTNFAAAPTVDQSFQVTSTLQTITFAPLADQVFGTTPPPLSATATSGLTVSFASQTAPICTVAGTTITLVAVGTCTIRASQSGNASFAAAPDVDRSFEVTPATITFPPLPDVPAGTPPGPLAATTNSGLSITYASRSPSVCTVSGTTITILSAGTCTIRANLTGTSTFADQSFSIAPAATTTTLVSSVNPTNVGQSVTFTATVAPGVAGGTITFKDGATTLGTSPVVGNSASFATSSLTAGAHSITASYGGDSLSAASTSAVLPHNVIANGTIALRVVTSDGDGTVSFTSLTPALAVSVTTSGGAGQSSPVALVPGAYSVTAGLPAGFGLTSVVCSDTDSTGSVGAQSASINLAAGEAVTCTFSASNSRKKTVALIQSFNNRRNDLLLSNDPEGTRQIDRLREFNSNNQSQDQAGASFTANSAPPRDIMSDRAIGPLSSFRQTMKPSQTFERTIGPNYRTDEGSEQFGGGSGLPFRFMAQTEDAPTMSFSMSLSQAMKFAAQQEERRDREVGQMAGLTALPGSSRSGQPNRFDMWAEGRIASFSDGRNSTDADGHFRLFYLGADYVVNPSFLIGALVQYDSLRMQSLRNATDIVGNGWMIGPYATVKLTDNLYFQGRAAWGRSSNSVSPYMTYSDNFDSERWLTRGTLQGQWQRGNWNFTPSASIAYIEDKTEAYRDGLGVDIPSIKSTLGQLKFGPEIAYRHLYSDGSSIEPRLKVEAIWNFTQSANGIADEPIAGIDDWRGRTELGLKMQSASGIALDISGGYDGIGSSSYHAVIGRAMVRVPLN